MPLGRCCKRGECEFTQPSAFGTPHLASMKGPKCQGSTMFAWKPLLVAVTLGVASYSTDAQACSACASGGAGFGFSSELAVPLILLGTAGFASPLLGAHLLVLDGVLIGQWLSRGRPTLGVARATLILSIISTTLAAPLLAGTLALTLSQPPVVRDYGWVAAAAGFSALSLGSLVLASISLAGAEVPMENARAPASKGPTLSFSPVLLPGFGGVSAQGTF